MLIEPKLTVNVSASVPGGNLATASAGDKEAFYVTGFRVFNAAGAQVTGFRMTPGGVIDELPPAAVGTSLPQILGDTGAFGLVSLVILTLASIASWGVMFERWRFFRQLDKKVRAGRINLVLLERIGAARATAEFERSDLLAVLA